MGVGGGKCGAKGSVRVLRCRYPLRDASSADPTRRVAVGHRGARARASSGGMAGVSAFASGVPGPEVLVPHWLAAAQRTQLATAVRQALSTRPVHPVAVVHLEDVLTELHVAAARDAVWPASAARVRLATGWDSDMLPVRLSAAELASVLALTELPDSVRGLLGGKASA